MICIHTDFFATGTGFKQGLEMIGFCDFYLQLVMVVYAVGRTLAIALQEWDHQFKVLF